MNQFIEIASDSEAPENKGSSSEGVPLRAIDEQLELPANKIVLYQEGLQKEWTMDARVVDCSQLLRELSTEQREDGNSLLTFYLPSTLKVKERYLKLIELFYNRHKFSKESIQIGKITYEGHKKELDPVSLQFLQDYLKKESFEDNKNLFDLCEFLKFTGLKQLIAVHVASQHFFFFNEKNMRKQIQQTNAYLSRQQEINLQLQMKNYASHLSQDLLNKLRQKYNKEFTQQQRR